MAEEKKPRIDLKARLGKKTVAAKSGSIPPPMGIPKPSVPFGGPQRQAPRVDASDPYAAISAEAAPVRKEQAIKVEMSEEVMQAQKRGRAKIIALAAVTALVGAFLGYAIGSGVERGKSAEAAVSGAGDLIKEVDTANAKIEELAEVLKKAKEKLADSTYPEEEVGKLGGINIPFEGANLTGKGIGRFRPDVVTLLIDFASGAQEANDQKEKIARLLGGSKPAIMEFLEVKTKPKVRWSVYVTNGPGGPWAAMQPLPEAFAAKPESDKKGWPEEFKIKDGDRTFELKRYKTGSPTGGEPQIIPVDPTTQGSVCPSDVLVKLRRELQDLEGVLRGDKSDPANEKAGLADTGHALVEKLKQIGRPG
jgi:hypothetical protein